MVHFIYLNSWHFHHRVYYELTMSDKVTHKVEIVESGKKKLRIQKYPDRCRRSLTLRGNLTYLINDKTKLSSRCLVSSSALGTIKLYD